MINIKPWSPMPTDWIWDERIKLFKWTADGSAGTAALVLFSTMCHFASEQLARRSAYSDKPALVAGTLEQVISAPSFSVQVAVAIPPFVQVVASSAPVVKIDPFIVAKLTYEEMGELTGLSRKLIASGLSKLEVVGMITRLGSSHAGTYRINGLELGHQWAKLPGQALLSPGRTSFLPFTRFHLRSKHELNAMKMYLYYAATRDRQSLYSEPSFEKIWSRTGVPERDIPKANSLLVATELLARIGQDAGEDKKKHESNKYYLAGYPSFVKVPT